MEYKNKTLKDLPNKALNLFVLIGKAKTYEQPARNTEPGDNVVSARIWNFAAQMLLCTYIG